MSTLRNCTVDGCKKASFKQGYCGDHYRELSGQKASAASGGISVSSSNSSCTKCSKTVYPEEQMRSGASDDGGKPCVYHKACFRCSECGFSLELTNCSPERATLYCRKCYENRHVKGTTVAYQAKAATSSGPSVVVETKRDTCTKCSTTVYASDLVRSGASDESGKPCLYHKACFRCSVCNTSLELHTSAPEGATLYCRQHYEERHVKGSVAPLATKGGASSGPSITITTKKDSCTKCGSTVYDTDLVRSGATDDDGKPCLYHKACFRCSVCNTSLELHTSAPEGSTLYCRQHYEERHVKGTTAPVKTKAGASAGPSITIATQRDTCTKCNTTVYASELMRSGTSDEKGKPCLYHKACFRCSVCNTSLELHTSAPEGKTLYCVQHYKEIHISRHDQTGALAAAKPTA